jgi:PEP-CTERM/exosortase A-associated glycosyltransferase
MSVAHLFDQTFPLVSGYSMRSKYITDSLHELGVPLRVFSSPIFTYKDGDETINGVPYTRSTLEGFETIKKFPIYREFRIIKALQQTVLENWRDDIRLISAHSSLLNGIAAMKIAKDKGVPVLYEVRAFWEDAAVDQGKTREGSLRYNLTRNKETQIVNAVGHVTVVCEGLKNDLLKRGVPDGKITVIPNGVDTRKFQPLAADKEIEQKYHLEGKIVFGFIGTFFYFEGLELLISAAESLVKDNPNIQFLLVGTGHEDASLKAMVKDKGLEDKVIFTGRVPHDEIEKYYSVVDIFVYPRISKRITELVTPLKPLEAMAMEKIVVGSDVGGIRELIREGENGVLSKAGDSDALAEKCQEVLNHLDKMTEMAKKSRQFVMEERNWKKICERYFTVYEKLGIRIS